MANKTLFQTLRGAPVADSRNEAGGLAYQLGDEAALAQLAMTGCLSGTFYATAQTQLQEVLSRAQRADPLFVAQLAVYARRSGFMKDMPALLLAVLAVRDPALLARAFPLVVDNAKMLRNFVQIIRSGVTGRRSLGTAPRRLIRQWLEKQRDEAIVRDSVGNSPSLADVVRMVHPKPQTKSREALYAWLIGREHDAAQLPQLVREFDAWKAALPEIPVEAPPGPLSVLQRIMAPGRKAEPVELPRTPDVPFQMLTAQPLPPSVWQDIARRASWQMTRMNLNTFARHGVFNDKALVRQIADRLRNPDLVAKAKVFPYQLLMAWKAADKEIPSAIREALQDAMELSTANVPSIDGQVVVCPDISGSMQSPVTGARGSATTGVRCLDIAALVAACMLRANRGAEVLPFSDNVVPATLNPRDSVMTNADKLAKLPSGGTNCSAPLRHLNARNAKADLVIYVSDNESWVDTPVHGRFGGNATATMTEWQTFKRRNPRARLVCLDIQPYTTTQAAPREDILNIGGFSDAVFEVIAAFASGGLGGDHWVRLIRQTQV